MAAMMTVTNPGENKHDVRRLGLALAREREGDLGLQILVELGRCLLILVKDGRLISRRRIFGICRHRRHRHAKRQDRTHSKSERASQPPRLSDSKSFIYAPSTTFTPEHNG